MTSMEEPTIFKDTIDDGVFHKAWQQLEFTFGSRFLRFLITVYFGVKGVSFAIITAVTLPIFQRMGVSGNDYQLAAMVANSPWSTKGFIGVLSDCFPLGRYHKRGYLQLFSAVGLLGGIGLAVAPTLTLTKVYL